MSNTNTSPSNASGGSVADVVKASAASAAQQLAGYISTVTGQTEASVAAFAEQYGPQYAAAAATLAAAKVTGDASEIAAAEVDIDVLNDDAVMHAAMVAIDAQAGGESLAMNILNGFVTAVVSKLLA